MLNDTGVDELCPIVVDDAVTDYLLALDYRISNEQMRADEKGRR